MSDVMFFPLTEPPKTIHLVVLLFSIFTGVGSGRLGELRDTEFYDSLYEKDSRGTFGHITDVNLSHSQTQGSGRLSKKKFQTHRRNHKHHRGHLDFLELHKSLLDFEQEVDIEERKFEHFLSDVEKVKQNPYFGSPVPHNTKKFDVVTFVNEREAWPRFSDIEILAGVAGWKKERWKEASGEAATEKPKSSRTTKFTYRRVQSTNGSKRNAIIAVSAIAQTPQEENQ